MTDQSESIAYHEAGHAVISMKLGYECLYVTIVPDGDRLGHVCGENPLTAGRDSRFEDAIKVLVAAHLSESKRFGLESWGDAEDRATARKIASLACGQDAERAEVFIEKIVGETRAAVDRHWPDIETLAQLLLTQGHVNFLAREGTATPNPASLATRFRFCSQCCSC